MARKRWCCDEAKSSGEPCCERLARVLLRERARNREKSRRWRMRQREAREADDGRGS